MSCDHELANEWARCSGKNASYITISLAFYSEELFQEVYSVNMIFASQFVKQSKTRRNVHRCLEDNGQIRQGFST